jgi:geranylgeranyl diphosphate synthase type II
MDGVAACACSLELIHTYSLIHDDLPALDNDDYRRGKLTNHKVFGDAMAILAGDALLTLAFQVLAQLPVSDDRKTRLIAELATASGTVGGMIGGQVADLEGEGKAPTRPCWSRSTRAKTGALLRASLRMGAIYAGASDEQYARSLAMASISGWRFRLWTTSWMWRSRRRRSVRRPARMRPSTRLRSPRSMGWRLRTAWRKRSARGPTGCWRHSAIGAARLHELADLIVRRKS